jgi:acetyltransferase-like isoleucine patch superfamily enzyme
MMMLIVEFVFTKLYLFLLIVRGFRIHPTVSIKLSSFFFQSYPSSIIVKSQSSIGPYVEIKSGFKGKIIIGKHTEINRFSIIDIQQSLSIGDNVIIGPYCYITDYDHAFQIKKVPIKNQGYIVKKIIIENNVWIGAHVTVLKGITIGEGAVIGAGSVVTKDISPNVIAAGNPAKVIRKR